MKTPIVLLEGAAWPSPAAAAAVRLVASTGAILSLVLAAGPASAAMIDLQCQTKSGSMLRIDVDPESKVLKEASDVDTEVFRDGVANPDADQGCVDFVTVTGAEFVWGLKCRGYELSEKIDRQTGQYVRLYLGPVYANCTRVSRQPRF